MGGLAEVKMLVVLGLLAVFSAWRLPGIGFASQGKPERTTAQVFNKHCSSCHGKDGRAKTWKSRVRYHARDLTDSVWQSSVTDERIFNSVFNGRGKMPAFGKKLSQNDVDALVKYVRAFRS